MALAQRALRYATLGGRVGEELGDTKGLFEMKLMLRPLLTPLPDNPVVSPARLRFIPRLIPSPGVHFFLSQLKPELSLRRFRTLDLKRI